MKIMNPITGNAEITRLQNAKLFFFIIIEIIPIIIEVINGDKINNKILSASGFATINIGLNNNINTPTNNDKQMLIIDKLILIAAFLLSCSFF